MEIRGIHNLTTVSHPRILYLRTDNGLEVDLIIEGENQRAIPVEIKLTRTPTVQLASALTRYVSLFAETKPEDGLMLCLADVERHVSRVVIAIGVEEYLQKLQH